MSCGVVRCRSGVHLGASDEGSRLCGAAYNATLRCSVRDTKLDGRVWLMRGDAGIANPILAAAIFLKFEAY